MKPYKPLMSDTHIFCNGMSVDEIHDYRRLFFVVNFLSEQNTETANSVITHINLVSATMRGLDLQFLKN